VRVTTVAMRVTAVAVRMTVPTFSVRRAWLAVRVTVVARRGFSVTVRVAVVHDVDFPSIFRLPPRRSRNCPRKMRQRSSRLHGGKS
jgi:hypothetical protein